MKVLFLGGGTGGHFYPLIAVAEEIYSISKNGNYLLPKMYYMGPKKFDEEALYQNDIKFIYCPTGKLRRERGILPKIFNFFGLFVTMFGIVKATISLLFLYPDVIFSKGGYASFSPLVAARILGIPVIIHESDSKVGIVNRWSAKFAKKIAISYPDIPEEFKKYKDKIAFTGIPIRKTIINLDDSKKNRKELFNLKNDLPVIFVLGGSQGSEVINNVIMDALPELLKNYQIIHQTGENKFKDVSFLSGSILKDNENRTNYNIISYLNSLYLKSAASVASIVISRAGSGTLFEIASWGLPSIIIPLPEDVSHDQRYNAYSYAKETGAVVIEQNNLDPYILISEINRIVDNTILYKKMSEGAKRFAHKDSAEVIAKELFNILLSHV